MALALGLLSAPFAAQAQFFIDLEIEQGTYRPGDPVSMMVTLTNTSPTVECGISVVQVTLSQDAIFGTEDDHNLTVLTGPPLAPGESYVWQWVQRIPGNISGTFFVHARAHTITSADCTGVASPFQLEDAKITIPPEDHPETSLVSLGESGAIGDSLSETPFVSQNGRWVAFATSASNLLGEFFTVDGEEVFIGPDNNGLSDIYIRDHWTGEIERVTRPARGPDPDGPSHLPRLSADDEARWVAYHSSASNLTNTQDNNGMFDVFLYDRQNGRTTLVSRSLSGRAANGVSQGASVSADGRWVAFESEASDLVANDTNLQSDIFVADMQDGTIRRVNVTNFGVQALGGQSRGARISADGRHIVFESRAANLAPNGNPGGLWEVYVHDRDVSGDGVFDEPGDIATIRLSVDYDLAGNPILSDGHSYEASLSPDGRFVTFVSEATTLFSEPATGSILFTGAPAEATVLFEESVPAGGIIGLQPDVPATGTVAFPSNPLGGEILQISDGTTNRTFEFAYVNWTVAPGNIRVFIGANPQATRNTLVQAINNAFLIDEEQTMWAEAVTENGQPAIRLTNLTNGEAGNQPIGDGEAPSLAVAGMSGAVVDQPAPGDSLVIDNNRTGPVTVQFFLEGTADPTDHSARILGVELGRTAKETSLNLLAVFHGLGYKEYDVPEIPADLLSPLAENPEPGDWFFLSRGDEEEGTLVEAAFTFVADGPQFDPFNPTDVRIGATVAETRGNLMRAIREIFTFEPLPAIIAGSGQPFAFGATFADSSAQGSISLNFVPPEDATLTLGDGLFAEVFRFVPVRDQTEIEEALGIPVPPFEPVGGEIRVYLTEEMTVEEATTALFEAIQSSFLDLTAVLGGGIFLVNNQVGPEGNAPMVIAPFPTEEELEEGTLPWANIDGMDGGAISTALEEGGQLVFYPENLLHPTVVFEFREDLADLSSSAHFGVRIGSTSAETEGNLLAVLSQSGLPHLIAEDPFAPEEGEDAVEGELTDPQVRLISKIGAAGGGVDFTYSPSDPADFAVLSSNNGETRGPSHGGTLTVDDGIGEPVVFEFTGDGSARGEHIPVLITGTTETIRDTLIAAINDTEELNVEAEALTGDEIGVRIVRTLQGPVTTVLVEGSDLGPWVDVVDVFSGQWNPEEGEGIVLDDGVIPAVTFEFVDAAGNLSNPAWKPVLIGSDRFETRDNLIEAIKNSNLAIEAVAMSDGGNPGVLLTHFSTGAVGNRPIASLTADPSFEINGMVGGGSLASGLEQIYLVDRDADENGRYDEFGRVSLELISISPLGTGGNHISGEPVVSADGRYVAFRSQADNLLPLTVTRSDGEIFTNYVDPQPLAAVVNGELVIAGVDLSSEISRFTDIDTFPNIYLYDRVEQMHRRVDVNRFGESMLASSELEMVGGAPRSSRHPSISGDGRYIVFESEDEPFGITEDGVPGVEEIGGGLWHGITNRHPLDAGNNTRDIYIHDRRFPSGGPVEEPGVSRIRIVSPEHGSSHQSPSAPEDEGTGTGAPPIAIRVQFDLAPGVAPTGVQIFANGSEIPGDALLRARLTQGTYRADWYPALGDGETPLLGDVDLYAVLTDTRRQTWQSEFVTVTILPPEVVPGDPANPVDAEAFVAQTFWDVLGRAASQAERQFFVGRLQAGSMTRGGVVAMLMEHQDFELSRWVIATYLTLVGDYPTPEQLEEGLGLLVETDDEADEDLDVVAPGGLLTLINLVQASDVYQLRVVERGVNLADDEDFFEFIWEDNLGWGWRHFDEKMEQVGLIGELGRDEYLLELIAGVDTGEITVVIVASEDGVISEENARILKGALILTLLDRPVQPGDIAQLSGSVAAAAQRIVSSYPYANRFDPAVENFFGFDVSSFNPTKNSEVFGTFDDTHFNYFAGEGWINHQEHGWLYLDGEGYPNGMWIWDHIQQEWLWTRLTEDRYPFFFSDQAQNWRFYFEGGRPTERHFYFYELDAWQTIKP